jgi:hypothetical protein
MSISKIYTLLKKYWAAFLAGLIFFIVGVLTIWGVAIWYLGATTLAAYKIGLVLLGAAIGLLELVESYRLWRIPFKHKS